MGICAAGDRALLRPAAHRGSLGHAAGGAGPGGRTRRQFADPRQCGVMRGSGGPARVAASEGWCTFGPPALIRAALGGGRVGLGILGDLTVRRGGLPVDIGSPKVRLLLAVLLSRPDRPVPSEFLMTALWGERPPRSARKNLQLYVHLLRKALGP